jgi:hypothetical protein
MSLGELEGLPRAYRLGEHMFVQWAVTALRRLALSTDEALAAASRIALLTNGHIDQVIEGVLDIYESERRRWDARSDATRAAQVRAVLGTDGLDLASAEKMLSTSLRGAGTWQRSIGPGQRGKARLKVARAHAQVADARREFHHQPATKLIRESPAIAVETWRSKDSPAHAWPSQSTMPDGRHSSGCSNTRPPGTGAPLIRVARFEPTSQVCSACGIKDGPKPLHVREWTCGACEAFLDRDINAAVNGQGRRTGRVSLRGASKSGTPPGTAR